MEKKVAVIGSGIFGISTAVELSKYMDTILFEKEENVIAKASSKNHFRHHHGYHYPRSLSTALESLAGRESFEREYGDCILPLFPNFYSVVNEGSLVNPKEYLEFCKKAGLPYEIVDPDPKLIDSSRVGLTIKVNESSYDPLRLRGLCQEKLRSSEVDLRLNSEIVGGNLSKTPSLLKIRNGENEYENTFDFIIDASYANTNKVKGSLGLPKDVKQYELMELLNVKIDHSPFGLINMDGLFTSVMPLGDGGIFSVAHTKESVLERRVAEEFDDNIHSFGKGLRTNREKIMEEAIRDFPILKEAQILESVYVTKATKASVDNTDERPSEITNCGNGVYSIFAGKIITSVNTAKKVTELINSRK